MDKEITFVYKHKDGIFVEFEDYIFNNIYKSFDAGFYFPTGEREINIPNSFKYDIINAFNKFNLNYTINE